MFTGLIRELGQVQWVRLSSGMHSLGVASKEIVSESRIGDSISVNGVCLTLVKMKEGILSFEMTEETVSRSNLGALKNGAIVNLEGSMKADGAFHGHFVLGHIDCTGKICKAGQEDRMAFLEIEVPDKYSHLMVAKGSIALDGVSLTIADINNGRFRIYLIPHTLDNTNLRTRKAGDVLNVEFDIIGKYAARHSEQRNKPGVTEEFLRENGFSDKI